MDEVKKTIEQMSFREAMQELEGIVGILESNTLELEDSLSNYERGIALLSSLRTRLAEAQQKIDVLVGELEETAQDEEIDTTLP